MNRKTTFLSLKCLFAVLCLQTMDAQQIYTNGPVSTGATHAATNTAAPTGFTWSEMQSPNTTIGAGFIYNNALTSDFSIADDFTVPAGQIWNISSADFFGYQTGFTGTGIPADVIRVRIWNGDPSSGTATVVFGNMTSNVVNAPGSADASIYRVTNATGTTRKVWKMNATIGTSLPAGTYFIEVQVHATNDAAMFTPPVTILNTLTDPSWNAVQRSGAVWADLLDLGTSNQLALAFNLNGAVVLGVNSHDFSSKVALAPNPASETVTIIDGSNSMESTVEIFDISGRMVKSLQSDYANNLTINVSDLSSGNYILKLKSANGVATKKFLKS